MATNTRKSFNMPSSLIDIQRDYVLKILDKISGMKALVLDDATVKVLSLIFMQSEGWKKDVYLSENIAKLGNEKLPSFVGVFLISATDTNRELLRKQLADPVFKEYHIFFTTPIDEDIIKYLAECDTYNVIKNLYEIFIDFQAVAPDCMTLELNDGYMLSMNETQWPSHMPDVMMRAIQGFSSMLLSLRKSPCVRYCQNSKICWKLSSILNQTLDHQRNNFSLDFEAKNRSLVIVTERKEDPITPLIFGWTYLDMLNEV